MMNFRAIFDEKFIIHRSSFIITKMGFPRVKRQLLPIHPILAGQRYG